MQKLQLGALPALAKVGIGSGLFFAWTMIERLVIEPLGIYKYMPYYRIEGPCVWDGLALTVIIVVIVYSSRPRTTA